MDIAGTSQDSGAYNMNVDQKTADTNPVMLIKEVQVMRGEMSARINIYFHEILNLQTIKEECAADLTCFAGKIHQVEKVVGEHRGEISITLIKGHDTLY